MGIIMEGEANYVNVKENIINVICLIKKSEYEREIGR